MTLNYSDFKFRFNVSITLRKRGPISFAPTCGMPAAPIDAAVAVMEMAMMEPREMFIWRTCEMKMAATAS